MLSRRRLLVAAAAGAAIPFLPAPGLAARRGASNWPNHGCGLDARRWNERERDLDTSKVERLAIAWDFEAGSGISGTPAVVGDRVVVGSWDGKVYALDRRTGKLLWSWDAGVRHYPPERHLGITTSPAISGNRVVVVGDRVACLDLETGRPVWQRTVGDPTKTFEYFWAPPLIHEGRVYAGASSGSETDTRPILVCLDLRDGSVLWHFYTVPEDVAGGALMATPSLDPRTRTLVVTTGGPFNEVPGPMRHSSSLILLRADSGKLLWADQVHPHETRDRDVNCAPVLVDAPGHPAGLIVAGAKDGLRGWDRATRQRLWHVQLTPSHPAGSDEAVPTSGPEGSPIAAEEDWVFFASNNHAARQSHFAGLEASTGEIHWLHVLPSFQLGAPSVANGMVFLGLTDGKLRAWHSRTGAAIWESPATEPIAGGAAIARGMVFHGTGAGPFLPGKRLIAWAPDGKATS